MLRAANLGPISVSLHDHATGSRRTGSATVAQMEAVPTHDPLFNKGKVRVDGRVIHDMYLFEVKSPQQSWEPRDYNTLRRTIPADQAFRPPDQGGCALLHSQAQFGVISIQTILRTPAEL